MGRAVVQRYITFCTKLAIVLERANAMKQFRGCLRQVLSKQIILYFHSSPSAAHVRCAAQLLRLCIPCTRRTAQLRRAIILSLMNCDYMNGLSCYHYCMRCCMNMEHCLTKFVSLLVWTLTAVGPNTYPIHRWKGGTLCIGFVLLMEVTGLLRQTMFLWLSMQSMLTSMKDELAAQLEAGHATVRRHQHIRGCQSHAQHVMDSSAACVNRFIRMH